MGIIDAIISFIVDTIGGVILRALSPFIKRKQKEVYNKITNASNYIASILKNRLRNLLLGYLAEVILLLILTFVISYNLYGIGNFSYIFYLSAIIILVPHIDLLYKSRKSKLFTITRLFWPKIDVNWILLFTILMPLLPALVIAFVLIPLHLDLSIVATVLSYVTAVFGLVTFAAYFCLDIFRDYLKHWKSIVIVLGITGLGLIITYSVLIVNNQNSFESFLFVIGTPLTLAAIILAFAPFYTASKKEKLRKLAGIDVVSFVFNFSAYIVQNFATKQFFSLRLLETPQSLETFLLVIGFGLLAFTLITFVWILAGLDEEIPQLDQKLEDNGEELSSSNTDYVPLKENIYLELSYLPIWPREDVVSAYDLSHIFELSVYWWDKEPLNNYIFSGVNKKIKLNSQYNSVIKPKIDEFIKQINTSAPRIIKEYIAVYQKVELMAKDRSVISAVINSVLDYDKSYWPNVYSQVMKTKETKSNYENIIKDLSNDDDVNKLKRSNSSIKNLKNEIDEL